jgi:voltage-gated potassium channel
MSPETTNVGYRWSELTRRQRRREVIETMLAVILTWVLLLGVYYLLPFTDLTSTRSLVRLALSIVAFAAVLAWQLPRVMHADLPVLRAVQALGGAIPLFLVIFAAVYLSLSHTSTSHFSEPLNHTGALYLTITVFSTVGFGDITPEGDLARIVVNFQMLLDLVVIGAVVRLLTTAAKAGVSGTFPLPSQADDGPAPQADATADETTT